MLFADLETRSRVYLKAAGARRYAADVSTQITTAVWYFHGTLKTACPVHPQIGTHPIGQLYLDLMACEKFVAHHASFDANVLQGPNQNPFLKLPVQKISCTMARAQALSLPAGLETLCMALNVKGKDPRGRALVMATCKPQRDGTFNEDLKTFRELLEYNVQDVHCLMSVNKLLPELSVEERKIFERSWRKNDIGLPIDLELATAIALRRNEIKHEAANELRELTGNHVTAVTQRKRILDWANSGNRAAGLDGTKKHEVAEALENPELHPDVRAVLEILQDSGGSAPTKAQALLNRHVGGYYKDATRYFGARSGRGTSEGANMFNIAKPSGKYKTDDVIAGLKAGFRYDNTALTDALRGCIVAPHGWAVVDNDLSNAELRLALWQSGDRERLGVLAAGGDLYMHNAIAMWNLPATATKDSHPKERFDGKTTTLGGNYQLGWKTYKALMRKIGRQVSDDRAQDDIKRYRKANPLLTDIWDALKTAFYNCLYEPPGRYFFAGKIALIKDGTTIWMVLPSGRSIPHYSCFVGPDGNMGFFRAKFGAMLPQKVFGGSLLEISCFAGDTRVLTISGPKRIDSVTVNDLIWDGCEWVTHRGSVCQGSKSVTAVHGIRATPDHLILLSEGRDRWQKLEDLSPVRLKQATDLAASLLPDGFSEKKEIEDGVLTSLSSAIAALRKKLSGAATSALHVSTAALSAFENYLMQITRETPDATASAIVPHGNAFTGKQLMRRRVATTQTLKLGNIMVRAASEYFGRGMAKAERLLLSAISRHFTVTITRTLNLIATTMMAITNRATFDLSTVKTTCSTGASFPKEKRSELVYDILDCGPKNRFMICSPDGHYLLAHNCQAMTRDIITACEDDIEKEMPDTLLLLDVYDSIVALAPVEVAEQRAEQMRAIMRRQRSWTEGLPLDAEGYSAPRMRK